MKIGCRLKKYFFTSHKSFIQILLLRTKAKFNKPQFSQKHQFVCGSADSAVHYNQAQSNDLAFEAHSFKVTFQMAHTALMKFKAWST